MYKALTFIFLNDPDDPEGGVKKTPGEKITKKELTDSGQTDENIQQLLDSKAISEDMEAEVDEAHKEVVAEADEGNVHIVAGDGGQGK